MITKVGNKNISQKKYFNFNENKFIYSTTTSEPTKSKSPDFITFFAKVLAPKPSRPILQ